VTGVRQVSIRRSGRRPLRRSALAWWAVSGAGFIGGWGTGAHLIAARALKEQYDDVEHVVTFFCDEGEKYINDYFTSP